MATKAQQVAILVEFLNAPSNEDRTVDEVAKQIVDSFYELLTRDMKEQPPVLKTGDAFKSLITNKVHHVAWNEGDLYWIITADSRYGCVGSKVQWEKYAVESKAKAGAPGSNKEGYLVGDKFTSNQRSLCHTIVAVADKCVLLRGEGDKSGRPYAEPNEAIEKHYRREKK